MADDDTKIKPETRKSGFRDVGWGNPAKTASDLAGAATGAPVLNNPAELYAAAGYESAAEIFKEHVKGEKKFDWDDVYKNDAMRKDVVAAAKELAKLAGDDPTDAKHAAWSDDQWVDFSENQMSWFSQNTVALTKWAARLTKLNNKIEKAEEAGNEEQAAEMRKQLTSFGFLSEIHTHSKTSGKDFWNFAKKGLLLDPTTYIGIGTLGAGTAAAQGGKQAAKFTIKEILKTSFEKTTAYAVSSGIKASVRYGAEKGVTTAFKQGYRVAAKQAVRGIAKETVKEGVEGAAKKTFGQVFKGSFEHTLTYTVAKEIKSEGLKKGLSMGLKKGWINGGVFALEGAGVGAYFDLQNQRSQIAMGKQEKFSGTQLITAGAMGFVMGDLIFNPGMRLAGKGLKATGKGVKEALVGEKYQAHLQRMKDDNVHTAGFSFPKFGKKKAGEVLVDGATERVSKKTSESIKSKLSENFLPNQNNALDRRKWFMRRNTKLHKGFTNWASLMNMPMRTDQVTRPVYDYMNKLFAGIGPDVKGSKKHIATELWHSHTHYKRSDIDPNSAMAKINQLQQDIIGKDPIKTKRGRVIEEGFTGALDNRKNPIETIKKYVDDEKLQEEMRDALKEADKLRKAAGSDADALSRVPSTREIVNKYVKGDEAQHELFRKLGTVEELIDDFAKNNADNKEVLTKYHDQLDELYKHVEENFMSVEKMQEEDPRHYVSTAIAPGRYGRYGLHEWQKETLLEQIGTRRDAIKSLLEGSKGKEGQRMIAITDQVVTGTKITTAKLRDDLGGLSQIHYLAGIAETELTDKWAGTNQRAYTEWADRSNRQVQDGGFTKAHQTGIYRSEIGAKGQNQERMWQNEVEDHLKQVAKQDESGHFEKFNWGSGQNMKIYWDLMRGFFDAGFGHDTFETMTRYSLLRQKPGSPDTSPLPRSTDKGHFLRDPLNGNSLNKEAFSEWQEKVIKLYEDIGRETPGTQDARAQFLKRALDVNRQNQHRGMVRHYFWISGERFKGTKMFAKPARVFMWEGALDWARARGAWMIGAKETSLTAHTLAISTKADINWYGTTKGKDGAIEAIKFEKGKGMRTAVVRRAAVRLGSGFLLKDVKLWKPKLFGIKMAVPVLPVPSKLGIATLGSAGLYATGMGLRHIAQNRRDDEDSIMNGYVADAFGIPMESLGKGMINATTYPFRYAGGNIFGDERWHIPFKEMDIDKTPKEMAEDIEDAVTLLHTNLTDPVYLENKKNDPNSVEDQDNNINTVSAPKAYGALMHTQNRIQKKLDYITEQNVKLAKAEAVLADPNTDKNIEIATKARDKAQQTFDKAETAWENGTKETDKKEALKPYKQTLKKAEDELEAKQRIKDKAIENRDEAKAEILSTTNYLTRLRGDIVKLQSVEGDSLIDRAVTDFETNKDLITSVEGTAVRDELSNLLWLTKYPHSDLDTQIQKHIIGLKAVQDVLESPDANPKTDIPEAETALIQIVKELAEIKDPKELETYKPVTDSIIPLLKQDSISAETKQQIDTIRTQNPELDTKLRTAEDEAATAKAAAEAEVAKQAEEKAAAEAKAKAAELENAITKATDPNTPEADKNTAITQTIIPALKGKDATALASDENKKAITQIIIPALKGDLGDDLKTQAEEAAKGDDALTAAVIAHAPDTDKAALKEQLKKEETKVDKNEDEQKQEIKEDSDSLDSFKKRKVVVDDDNTDYSNTFARPDANQVGKAFHDTFGWLTTPPDTKDPRINLAIKGTGTMLKGAFYKVKDIGVNTFNHMKSTEGGKTTLGLAGGFLSAWLGMSMIGKWLDKSMLGKIPFLSGALKLVTAAAIFMMGWKGTAKLLHQGEGNYIAKDKILTPDVKVDQTATEDVKTDAAATETKELSAEELKAAQDELKTTRESDQAKINKQDIETLATRDSEAVKAASLLEQLKKAEEPLVKNEYDYSKLNAEQVKAINDAYKEIETFFGDNNDHRPARKADDKEGEGESSGGQKIGLNTEKVSNKDLIQETKTEMLDTRNLVLTDEVEGEANTLAVQSQSHKGGDVGLRLQTKDSSELIALGTDHQGALLGTGQFTPASVLNNGADLSTGEKHVPNNMRDLMADNSKAITMDIEALDNVKRGELSNTEKKLVELNTALGPKSPTPDATLGNAV